MSQDSISSPRIFKPRYSILITEPDSSMILDDTDIISSTRSHDFLNPKLKPKLKINKKLLLKNDNNLTPKNIKKLPNSESYPKLLRKTTTFHNLKAKSQLFSKK